MVIVCLQRQPDPNDHGELAEEQWSVLALLLSKTAELDAWLELLNLRGPEVDRGWWCTDRLAIPRLPDQLEPANAAMAARINVAGAGVGATPACA